jgi:hypothetical protein
MLFNENLFAGLTSGDISRYSIYSNGVANLNEMARVPYVWWSIPYWLISSTIGIPMLFSLLFSSFLVIILPAGVHFFVRTVFPPKKNHIQLTVFFTFIGLGATAVYPLYVFFTNSRVFFDYTNGHLSLEILNNFFNMTGAPGLTQQLMQPNPSMLDIAVLAYISALFYSQLSQNRNIKKLLIISFLFTSSIYIHSFNSAFSFIFIMMFFSLIKRKYAIVSFQITVFSIMMGVIFEIISGFFLIGKIPEIFSQKNLIYSIVGSVICLLLFYLRYHCKFENKLINTKKSIQNSQLIHSFITTITQKHLLFYLGISVFVISTVSFLINPEDGFSKVWKTRDITIPFALLLIKNYGPFLIFTFSALVILHKTSTKSVQFIGVFIISCMIVLILSLIIPNIFAPSIIYTRYSSFIAIPVVGLGMYAILTYMEEKRGRMFKIILLSSVIVILVFASMSDAFSRERYVTMGETQPILDQDIEAINWINKNSKQNERVVVFDQISETYLTSLGENLVTVPFVLKYTNNTYSQSWVHQILQDTSSDDVKLYILNKMNISYLLVRNSPQAFEDVEKGTFSIPESFPIMFEKKSSDRFGKTTIYKVPEYRIINEAPDVLVRTTKCMDNNFNGVFNQMVTAGYQFDIIDDLDFTSDVLDLSHRKTFILFNTSCYNLTLDEIIDKIPKNAIIYITDENIVTIQTISNNVIKAPMKQIIKSMSTKNNNNYTNSIKEYNLADGILENIIPSYQATKLNEKLVNQGVFRSDLKMIGNVEIFSDLPFPYGEKNSITNEYHTSLKNSTVTIFHNSILEVSKIGIKNGSSDNNSDYETFFVKNPRLKLDGKLMGDGEVIIPTLNKYSAQFENVSLDGKFTIHINYNSGLVYIEIIPN